MNVERLKHHAKKDIMLQNLEETNADILVLTETDRRYVPAYPYECYSPLQREIRPDYYREMENRVSIYSRFQVNKEYKTYDGYTALCVESLTDEGNLLVYGTTMGIFGNREASFNQDLEMQMNDIRRLSMESHSLCVIGDFNLSFMDNYDSTKFGRNLVRQTFRNCEIEILTQDVPECVDYIAVSKGFAGERAAVVEWNKDKSLSDHKGIVVEINDCLH